MFKIIFEENEIKKEVELNNIEFKVLNLAVNHNHGIINLCSETEAIKTLFNMGFLTIVREFLTVKKQFIPLFLNFREKDKLDFACGCCKNGVSLIQY